MLFRSDLADKIMQKYIAAALLGLGAYNLQGCSSCDTVTVAECLVEAQEGAVEAMMSGDVCSGITASLECYPSGCCDIEEGGMTMADGTALIVSSGAAVGCDDLTDPCA